MVSSVCLFLVVILLASRHTGAQDTGGTEANFNNSTATTTTPPPTSPPVQYCEIGHNEETPQLTDNAMNTLVVLDDTPSCDGVIKSVSILLNLPDGQSDAYLMGLTVTLVTYRYSTVTYQSELDGSLTLESSSITITHKAEGTEIKASINPRQKERLTVESKLFNIGVVLTGSEGIQLEWGLSTNHRSYSLQVDSPDQLPELLPLYTSDTRTPSVRFEIGAESLLNATCQDQHVCYACGSTDEGTGNTAEPTGITDLPTRPSGRANAPAADTSLIVGVAATVIAAVLVVLAFLALGITLLIKCGRRDRPTKRSANHLQVANDVHRRPSSSTIVSKLCVLDGDRSGIRSNSLPPTPFQLAVNGGGMEWSIGATAGGMVFAPADVPPFPMPTYEVQNSVSTVILKGSDTGTKDMKSATMSSRLTEALYDTPVDGKLLTPKGSLYRHQEYDDVADRPYEAPPKKESKIYDYLQRKDLFKVQRDDLKIVDYLGSGNFADIHKAVWTKAGQAELYVATKTLVSKSKKDRLRFLQEAHMMSQFNHVNIVKIHGVLAEKEPAMIVLELMQGDLRKFLQDEASVLAETCPEDLQTMFLRFARETAAGMKYLSRKGFIHRDLAARNILVTENQTCKISDFGLARDLSGDGIYQSQGGSIPVKWTAPEALHYGSYTSASDVWSFGIVLFEIWSLGKKPYQGLRNEHVLSFLENGQRLDPPPGVPRAIYSIMIDCWHPQPEDRPCFTKLEEVLSDDDATLLDSSSDKSRAGTTEQDAHVLGASVMSGRYIYPTLQNKYLYDLDKNNSL